ncbi:S9 family peptidase [Permianibacter sp. IMCC34836]|nr:S9 family peptidase [Permianibacter fluminis]
MAMAGMYGTTVTAEQLTLERLYQDPSLSGPVLQGAQFSPDGERITFLRATEGDRQDLWQYQTGSGEISQLVDASALTGGEENLSAEEQARRERQRVSGSGIVSYQWSPDGQSLLFPLAGQLYLYNVGQGSTTATGNGTRVLGNGGDITDVRFSSLGRYVSLVREQNLFVIDVQSGRERQLTVEGGGPVKFGMAEFVAQEEMDRDTGYWWSPNDQYLAFTRVDESAIGVEQRYEQGKDGLTIVSQRYPRAGKANAKVQLGVMDLLDGHINWIDLGKDDDIYLARVDWLPDSRQLAIQRQSRDQKKLDLIVHDTLTGRSQILISETSPTWVNLHSDLRFLKTRSQFVWASERSGFKHLYLYDRTGKLVKPLTEGPWQIEELKAIDEANNRVWFTGYADSAMELHLYSVSLDGGPIQKMTQGEGWHNTTVSDDGEFFLDNFSSPSQPPLVRVHRRDGSLATVLLDNTLNGSHPYAPYLSDDVQPTFGSIKSADGQDLYYRLYQPAKLEPGKKYPVIVDVYGGPHGARVQKSWDSRNAFWHKLMAQKGFFVFSLDNRGTNRRGVRFEAPIHRQLGAIEVADQQAGVAFLRSLPQVDGKRIGVFGWSYGGYMTLMMLMQAPQDFVAGVSVAPVTDWTLYDTHYTERYLGNPAENKDGYAKSAVMPYVDKLQGKLLLVHGMADDNVLFLNSAELINTLQRKNKPFELMLYPGSKHGITGRDLRLHLFSQITDFFQRQLGGPEPAAVTAGAN